LSDDHKPINPEEEARINDAGLSVIGGRVSGNLALSRAIGDFHYNRLDTTPEKQAVTCFPDVSIRKREFQDDFIMLACDGIWDCLTNQECIDKLNQYLNSNGNTLPAALTALFEEICPKTK